MIDAVARGSERPATRGRRPGESGTREAILVAARGHFADVGYPKATMRSIARAAGVDARLITHYFGSKQQLFAESIELPYDPHELLGGTSPSMTPRERSRQLTAALARLMADDLSRNTMIGIIRAAATEPEAADAIRAVLTRRLLSVLAANIDADHPERRASPIASQMIGLMFTRHIVRLPEVTALTPEQIGALIAPVIEHYLTVDLS